jgi:hypothetical protein
MRNNRFILPTLATLFLAPASASATQPDLIPTTAATQQRGLRAR